MKRPAVLVASLTLSLNALAGDQPIPTAAPNAPVTVVDVDAPTTSGDPYATYKDAFRVAKAATALTGANAVRRNYHAGLVPPFCLAAVKAFFDSK